MFEKKEDVMFTNFDTLEQATHAQPRVTALLACQDNVMPASWHMPVSRSPFRYAVAVREENYTHKLLEEHGSFTLNFLPLKHYETVDLMGRTHGDKDDKLSLSKLSVAGIDTHDNLLLTASDFIYECVVCDTYKNGDHTIYIADVSKIHVNEEQSNKPMLFSGRGRYSTVGETYLAPKAQ